MTTTFATGTPNWVELGTTDVAAAGAFYSALFGWTVQDLGPETGGYGFLLKDGQQVAGIGPATDPGRGTSWAVYFATPDVDGAAARVEAHGGKIVAPPMDVMDQGRMAVFQDPAGAYFSVWQAGLHRGAELVAATGAMSWIELMTTDQDMAKDFYPAVLGVAGRDVEFAPGVVYTVLEVASQSVAGVMAAPDDSSRWFCYFAVDDCDAVADQALALGGTQIVRGDTPAGRFAFLTDPQGGTFAIIVPNPDFSV
jgi:predicted enzyme related to lactoylglutathione lyase